MNYSARPTSCWRQARQARRRTGSAAPVTRNSIAPGSSLGGPQINVPVPRALRRSQSDLPLGVQVIGRPNDDVRALSAAHWVEQQLKRASATGH